MALAFEAVVNTLWNLRNKRQDRKGEDDRIDPALLLTPYDLQPCNKRIAQ